jgi:hypothetical protein
METISMEVAMDQCDPCNCNFHIREQRFLMELSLAIASLAKHSDKSAEVQQEDEDSER